MARSSSAPAVRGPVDDEGCGRKAFLFDANRCTGCQACELACTIENELEDASWRRVTTFNPQRHPAAPVIHLSQACNHCADPPCAQHCPALAYSVDRSTGRVTLHEDLCIGCRYCSWACPYDAPRFDPTRGVMTKCTFCAHRQEAGLEPACVAQCPTGALGFGDLAALPGEESALGLPTTEPRPSVRFIPWRSVSPRNPSASPKTCDRPVELFEEGAAGSVAPKISLGSEWPLVGFSLMAAALVAVLTASKLGSIEIMPLPFLAAAFASLGLSSLHLGRKARAWRAILNFRRSWLSREVGLYSGFVGLAGLSQWFPEAGWLTVGAIVVGFAALFAIDRVYDLVLRHEPYRLHSADVFLTAPFLAAVLMGDLPLALLFAAPKLGLYGARKIRLSRSGRRVHRGWTLLRLVAGFTLPLAAGWVDPVRSPIWTLAGIAVGELVDRCELYSELRVPTPEGHMARSLADLLSRQRSVRAPA